MTITADIEAVIKKAESQLGTSENPPYSNKTPYGAWYGMQAAWCAMFVSWVFWHAGYPLPAIRTPKGFAYCPDIVNWAKRNGTWRPSASGYTPKRGDIVLFDFIGRPSHVGIVTGLLKDGRIQTIEGNTNAAGSRTGGNVMRHNRARRGSTIGYVEVYNTAKRTGFRRGDKGPGVEFLQGMLNILHKERINAKGVAGGRIIEADSDFGAITEEAVREVQRFFRAMGQLAGHKPEDLVKVTGEADDKTLKLIAYWVPIVLGA